MTTKVYGKFFGEGSGEGAVVIGEDPNFFRF